MRSKGIFIACCILACLPAVLAAESQTMWYDVRQINNANGGMDWSQSSAAANNFSSPSKTCLIQSGNDWAFIDCPSDCPVSNGAGATKWYDAYRQTNGKDATEWSRDGATSFGTSAKTCLIQSGNDWATIACPVDTNCPVSNGNGGTMWYDTSRINDQDAFQWRRSDSGMSTFSTPKKTCLIQSNGSWATIDCPD